MADSQPISVVGLFSFLFSVHVFSGMAASVWGPQAPIQLTVWLLLGVCLPAMLYSLRDENMFSNVAFGSNRHSPVMAEN